MKLSQARGTWVNSSASDAETGDHFEFKIRNIYQINVPENKNKIQIMR